MENLELKRVNLTKYWKFAIIAIGAAIVAPIAWMALEGIVAIGACAVALAVIWNFAPVVATYLANKKIQALIAVVEANPIETMTNLYVEKYEEFKRQEEAVTEFDTQFMNVKDLVTGLQKTDPEEAVQYAEMAERMEQGLVELRADQAAAQDELNKAKAVIAKMKRIWTVACAMNKALVASATAQQQVFADMKQTVAVDKVRSDLNRAFANLNTNVERRRNARAFAVPAAPKAIEAPKATVTEIPSLPVKTAVRR